MPLNTFNNFIINFFALLINYTSSFEFALLMSMLNKITFINSTSPCFYKDFQDTLGIL